MGGRIEGRTVLITGAASGIGAACARRFAAEGARVVLADLDGGGAARLAAELGQVAVQADVTRPEDVERMIEVPYARWGRLDVLFNNAGIIQAKPLLAVTRADWDRLMEVNLKAVFFVLQAAARRMVQQDPIPGSQLRGKLIQTASIAAYRGGLPLTAPYAASKAGVVSLTRSAAQALAPYRITSNCVCPGVVDTPLLTKGTEDLTPEERAQRDAIISRMPLIPPSEIAEAVLEFVRDDSLTGQAMGIMFGHPHRLIPPAVTFQNDPAQRT